MIRISQQESAKRRCNSCFARKDTKDIDVSCGESNRQNTISLCKDCREWLLELLYKEFLES